MTETKRYKSQVTDIIAKFVGQANVLSIPVALIDATGSIDAALFLSQLLYWSDRGSLKDGWIAKSYAEWHDEIRLSKYEVSKAAASLADAGVQTKVAKWNGAPTVHYRIEKETFWKWIVKKLDNPGSSRNLTNQDSEETSQTYTETTQQTTAEKRATSKKASGKKPAVDNRTPAQVAQDAIAQAFYDVVAMPGATPPKWEREHAAALLEQGATPEMVSAFTAERAAHRSTPDKLAYLAEDFGEWLAERQKRERAAAHAAAMKKQVDQERAWTRELIGGAA